MREDILLKFCEGMKPRTLIKKSQGGLAEEEKGESKKTVYYYYNIYNNLIDDFVGFHVMRTCPHCSKPIYKDESKIGGFANELIRIIVRNLRIK